MGQRLDRRPQERIFFETPFGNARGTSTSFLFQGRQLNVKYGIDQAVDQSLTESAPESITEAQSEFARRLAAPQEPPKQTTDELYSATSDGSVFSLSLS
jgi:hypothetical protein